MADLTLPSPAKLNLFLHIVGRRPDGYHELQTLFQFLDYGDELSFTLTPDEPGVRLADPIPGVPDSDNLVVRAALALAELSKAPLPGVTIHLHKRLPMGGGLGGAVLFHPIHAIEQGFHRRAVFLDLIETPGEGFQGGIVSHFLGRRGRRLGQFLDVFDRPLDVSHAHHQAVQG